MYNISLYNCKINIWNTSALFTENLSADKSTAQYRNIDTCNTCDAGRAVDGDMNTCMRTEDIGRTSVYDKITWWYVDLGDVYNVYNIRILFRDYPGESKYVRNFRWFTKVSLRLTLNYIWIDILLYCHISRLLIIFNGNCKIMFL